MSKTLLLFDIDGTLLKTSGAGMRAMNWSIRQVFGQTFSLDGIQVSGHLDPLIFAEVVAMNELEDGHAKHDQFREQYLAKLEEELAVSRHDVYALDGIHDTLAHLRRREDVVLGMLTGNYTQAVPIKLKAVGIDRWWFKVTAFGDEGPSRADLVAVAMEKYAAFTGHPAKRERVIVIGDTPRDVACAHAHGCIAFAVATGRFSVEQLQEAGADVTVADLSDPSPLFELIDSRRSDGAAAVTT